LERRRVAASTVLSGTVRISTGECAAGFLARCLSGSTTTALPSGITLELVDSRQTANLARREADMALRHQPPETGDFYISRAGTFGCAVYRRRGADTDAWVTYTEEQAHYGPARWVLGVVINHVTVADGSARQCPPDITPDIRPRTVLGSPDN
jgi:DNA-binding transcriptional LysR family regulator